MRGNSRYNPLATYVKVLASIRQQPGAKHWWTHSHSPKGLWKLAFGLYRALRGMGVECEGPPGYDGRAFWEYSFTPAKIALNKRFWRKYREERDLD